MRQLFLILTLLLMPAVGCAEQASKPAVKQDVLDFHATWCVPCKVNAPAINRLEREGVKIVRIDIDQQRALASKYNITSVPTYIVRLNGREVFRTQNAVSLRNYLKRRAK